MRRILTVLTFLLGIVGCFAAGNGLLWKICGNGLPAPSYILGSHHLAPAEFVDSIPGLRDALSHVDAVYGEVTRRELSSPAGQQRMMMYALAPADSTLSKLLTPSEIARLDSLFAVYTGQHGVAAQMEMLKPAVVGAQLAVMQISAAFPQMRTDQPFDAVVMALGEETGKEIGGLETLYDQLKLLFGAPLTAQAADLMEAVHNNDKQVQQAFDLTNSYLRQDLDEVTRITFDTQYGVEPESLDRLIFSRNSDWVESLSILLPQKPMLIVVGCGHLGGEKGILSLLREKGYTVTSVR